jgi:hypothetical protein
MSSHDTELAYDTSRLVEYAELPQDRSAVIVDSFTGQTVIGVKRVHAAKRELDSSPRSRKATPAAEVSAANHHFNENGILSDMPALHRNLEIG